MKVPTESFERKAALWVPGTLTIIIASFHILRFFRAGGLWRDEAAAQQLATMPQVSDLFQWFPHEAFPPPFFLLVRLWVSIVGNGDLSIRLFGFLCGLCLLAAIWSVMWFSRRSAPLISIALIGFNGAFITWGDELRGYGLGSAFIVLTIGLIWRLVEKPTPARAAAAAVGAVCATQVLLHNAILLGAICAGGVALAWRRGQLRTASLVALAGAVAAACLLPYGPRLQSAREWDMIVRTPEVLENVRANFLGALGASGWWNIPMWALVFVAALAAAVIGQLGRRSLRLNSGGRDVLLFCGIGLAAGGVAYFIFLAILGYPTQAWYYLALLAFTAILADLIFDSLKHVAWVRIGRLCLIALVALSSLLPALHSAQMRMTNIDLISRELEGRAVKGDLVVVMPWELGISFNRYYHGPAQWVTVPPIESHVFHRYDLVKAQMVLPDQSEPIRPVIDAIKATLNDGHHVWVVSLVAVTQPVEALPELVPAPNGQYHWNEQTHTGAWCLRVLGYIQGRSGSSDVVDMKTAKPVNPFEDLRVTRFSAAP